MPKAQPFAHDEAPPASAITPVAYCPICGGEEGAPVYSGVGDWFFCSMPHDSDFWRCSDCGSLWINNRLDEEWLRMAYSHYYTHTPGAASRQAASLSHRLKSAYVQHRFGGSHSVSDLFGAAIYRTVAPGRLELDAAHRFASRAPADLLDYGCGSGDYMRRMAALGHSVTGVDFDPAAVESASASGLTVVSPQEAESQNWNGAFDHISLAHVIEHVPEPAALLQRLARWLKPDGTLFLEAPNASAGGLRVLGQYWRGLEAPRHLAIPSRSGLQLLAKQAGLTITQQIIRPSVPSWLWQESMEVVPANLRDDFAARLRELPTQSLENAEFLTVMMARMKDVP